MNTGRYTYTQLKKVAVVVTCSLLVLVLGRLSYFDVGQVAVDELDLLSGPEPVPRLRVALAVDRDVRVAHQGPDGRRHSERRSRARRHHDGYHFGMLPNAVQYLGRPRHL